MRRLALVTATIALSGGCAFGAVPGPTIGRPAPASPSAAASQPHTTATITDHPSPRPLPGCAYRDEPVLGDPRRDWATLVLDTVFTLPEDFAPARLVSTRRAGLNGGYRVSRVMLDDLTAMADAARGAGAAFAVQSAYRSHADQVRTYQGWVDQSSEREARLVSARPGHSEHQLGTAVDLRSADDPTPPWESDDFASTPAGSWLAEHAWEYGFVMSYPRGKRGETCYTFEPWHYRYVGRDVAAAIHDRGLTPRRYLWETYWATTPR